MWRYLLIILGLSAAALAWADPSPDFNGDGLLNVYDVIAVVYCVVGIECPDSTVELIELNDGDMVRWNEAEGVWETVTPEGLSATLGVGTVSAESGTVQEQLDAQQVQLDAQQAQLDLLAPVTLHQCTTDSWFLGSSDYISCFSQDECTNGWPSGNCVGALARLRVAGIAEQNVWVDISEAACNYGPAIKFGGGTGVYWLEVQAMFVCLPD